ncbi:MAG: SdiA-regulated domain-containing protein [Nonlabens sp.]|uniref:SdiA-regulated domain-containing protein n=1 Tax=Nonlabens sp. TaxID=1888209 RepID=UPI0032993055
MNKIVITVLGMVLCFSSMYAQETIKLKPTDKKSIDVPEPSDIAYSSDGKSLFVVSDNGYLFETDLEGTILRKADYQGLHDEAVYANDSHVYVVEEYSRKIKMFRLPDLTLEKTVAIPYSGGRNKAYEGFTYNKAKGVFSLFVEKDPLYVFELNEKLEKVNEINLGDLARDISAATYYDNYLWLLSDEDRTIFKVNPTDYTVVAQWVIPVLNAEGLAFDKNGDFIVASDALQRLYYFNNPENNQ